MRSKLSRRKFLKGSVAGSVAVGCGILTQSGAARPSSTSSSTPALVSLHEQSPLLRAAMDEIIPASDGMPSASQAGGVEYLERLVRENPGIGEQLSLSLEKLDATAEENFHAKFVSLGHDERVKALAELEMRAAPLFAAFRDFVYEAYYTQPKVWKLIGYEFYPTNGAGPHMKPFDAAALAEVRKKPKYYREA